MRRQIQPAETHLAMAERIKAGMYKSMPGIVQAYYPGAPATVDVQPAINDVRFDLDGNRVSEPWPIIPRVPVCYPAGGGYMFTFPMAQGDKVELISDDLDPTVYRMTGNASDPQDVRRHGGNYWKALPCDTSDASAPAAGTTLKIGKGPATIEIDGSTIALGGSSDAVALASLVKSEFSKFALWVKTGLAPSGGGAVTYAAPAPADDVASTLVKSG